MHLTAFTRVHGRHFFLSNAINLQSRPSIASMMSFNKPLNLVLNKYMVKLRANLSDKTSQSISNPIKSSFGGLFDGSPSRYARLNRFQDYSPKRSNDNKIIKLTLWGILFMGGSFLLSPYLFDIKPFSYFKLHPTHLPYALIGINCAVFGLWQLPRFWLPLQRYALLQKDHIYSKWSLIGSAFSHQEFWHFGMNMMCLWSFGTSLAVMLGPANFTSLYLNSAIAGSLFSLWYPKIARIAIMGPSLGASGALFGLFAVFSYLAPDAKIMLLFFPMPVGAWYTFLGLAGWNVVGCVFRWGMFDYAAHVGGSVMGVLYGWWISKRIHRGRKARRLLSFPRF
ncbi:rhomboid protease PCP1 Ecym_4420 [Eremothecium cymbalariae DBVPG|uniref:Peptidase S54 rhomboid domain-containing protein n=1 Tax=Eremothecium cymbalariae (strain CBS 270.75 / DBVPG 7215 / KCTC 17166 / NRRL Y-17582) TaxID=931890 RepID=G8JTW6_ERECY|nr:hypothetical protein Ecym_4420 [Eremothecium cymbalariae DBVPG\